MVDIETFFKIVQLTVTVGKFAREIKRSRFGSKATIDTSLTEERLKDNVKVIERWASIDQVEPMAPPRQLSDIYIELSVKPANKAKAHKTREPSTVSDLDRFDGSVVLLGQPGAGKTTAVKRLLSMTVSGQSPARRFPISFTLRSVRQSNACLITLRPHGHTYQFA